jgi:hypothetical protein
MDSNDLTRDQGLQVFLETREILGRIYALVDRMKQRRFPPDDPVYASTVAAWEAFIVMNKQWQRVALGPGAFAQSLKPQPPTQ